MTIADVHSLQVAGRDWVSAQFDGGISANTGLDVTAAINAFLAANPGKEARFGAGVYLISGNGIFCPFSYQRIVGAGFGNTVFQATGACDHLIGFAASSSTLTACSEVGTVATFTTSAAHGFVVGQTVSIAGVTPGGYNGTWVIASVPSTTTFTAVITASGLGVGTVFGTAATGTRFHQMQGFTLDGAGIANYGLPANNPTANGVGFGQQGVFRDVEFINIRGQTGAFVDAAGNNITGCAVLMKGLSTFGTRWENCLFRFNSQPLYIGNGSSNHDFVDCRFAPDTTSPFTTTVAGLIELDGGQANITNISFFGCFASSSAGLQYGGVQTLTACTNTGAGPIIFQFNFTTAAAHNLSVGQSVTIAGVTPAGYNGVWIVTSTPTPTTFVVNTTTSGLGAGSVFGTATPAAGLDVFRCDSAAHILLAGGYHELDHAADLFLHVVASTKAITSVSMVQTTVIGNGTATNAINLASAVAPPPIGRTGAGSSVIDIGQGSEITSLTGTDVVVPIAAASSIRTWGYRIPGGAQAPAAYTLPTQTPVSGTTYQNTSSTEIEVWIPITFNANAAATTVTIGLGPTDPGARADITETIPIGSVNGIVRSIRLRVPAYWFFRVTNTVGTAVIGATTSWRM